MKTIWLWALVVLSSFHVSSSFADNIPQPKAKTILTIAGNIEHTNGVDGATFDLQMLENIGLHTIATTNPWYEGRTVFEGIFMEDLMALVGAKGKKITAIALNDYVTTIPIEDFKRFHVLLALKRDGNYMPVRDKGPLFIVYPYDSDPQLQSQIYYTRSAWQVSKLIVE